MTSIKTVPLTTDRGAVWTVTAMEGPAPEGLIGRPIAATVPGEVHTDLLAAGEIPDPFDGDNESKLHWIGRTRWSYRTEFDWTPDGNQRQDLVAEGIDTLATMILNGQEFQQVENQHRPRIWDVTRYLVAGRNELVFEFEGPVTVAEEAAATYGDWPHTNHHPYNAIRKMASNFGWDWGPDVATVGIWQPIWIESWTGAKIQLVQPLATVDGDRGVLNTRVLLDWTNECYSGATVRVEVGGTVTEQQADLFAEEATLISTVDAVDLWWPRGHGEQPLYDVVVTVRTESGEERWDGRVGFRTMSLNVAPDNDGTPFVLSVNDKPIYIRGANWIPDDAFVTRLNAETYRTSIQDAFDAGMNLLRVWGGGLYESEAFYDACDELGILVWQDFLFACAAYSEDEPMWREVEAEAREAVGRLSKHASLAVWNGNNENIWGYVEWGWRVPLAGRPWGQGYYFDLLPKIVAELDPRTPYSPGSPYSFDQFIHPNDDRHGTMHIWDVWNQVDYTTYRKYKPRFVSEFGFQGPPAWSTLTSVVHDSPLDPYGPQMLVHQKASEGNLKLERGLGDHLPVWKDIDDWHWTTQLNQARAVAYGIEHFRSLFPLNTGAVVWQLNDNWPVVSWAAVDGHGIRKPLWFALKRVYAERLLTVQPREDELVVAAHNDTDSPWTTEITATRRSTGAGGQELARETFALEVAPRSAVLSSLPGSITKPADPTSEYLEVRGADGSTAYWYFVEDTSLRLAGDAYASTVRPTEDGYDVTVSATALAKDLALFPDRLDAAARVDSCLVTLSAGESHTFHVTGGSAPAQVGVPVLRSANDLVNRITSRP